jgi:uncharacterized protein YndB with AHSA1/START domain
MTELATDIRSVVVERDLPHPPERVWRALTQGDLLEAWLMKNDFAPVVGHRFSFRADWGSVEGQVRQVEPNQTLAYSWEAFGLASVVTWTLTPTQTGTNLRMEQTGFRADQTHAFMGAKAGWPRFLVALEQVLETLH